MALPDISLAQFNRIASGSYNAGQIDIQVGKDGKAGLDTFEKVKLAADARSIATDELGLSVWSSFSADNVFNEIVKDSKSLGGDNAYQIDIGV